jgi:hypothetical protein
MNSLPSSWLLPKMLPKALPKIMSQPWILIGFGQCHQFGMLLYFPSSFAPSLLPFQLCPERAICISCTFSDDGQNWLNHQIHSSSGLSRNLEGLRVPRTTFMNRFIHSICLTWSLVSWKHFNFSTNIQRISSSHTLVGASS